MPKTMLIDACHREETRVAVLQGGKVEDFDFEYASRKPLRGNIYLARVTRVEPSLQAAFIEYGGNRHGFLAFGEIHPDYYQIPVADREVLRKAEALEVELARKLAELSQDDDDADIDPDEDEIRASADTGDAVAEAAGADTSSVDDDDEEEETPVRKTSRAGHDEEQRSAAPDYDPGTAEQDLGEWHGTDESLVAVVAEDGDEDDREEEEEEEERTAEDGGGETVALSFDGPETRSEDPAAVDRVFHPEERSETEAVDRDGSSPLVRVFYPERGRSKADIAAKEAEQEIAKLRSQYEEAKRDRNRLLRAYKIQEVIKRRQIMLVQVVKEERGNKGAALTTYLSLAGRYGVLMPNTARGGGISRKITSPADRKRLKKAMKDFDIPSNMGLIVRTAGAKRTKTEIKRDYDYLLRLWETIRDRTLQSVAPCLIYEEASLIKRAIRDLYDKDTETVYVHGEEGYREAKDFMKMLMPSHAKFVQQHKGDVPLFLKHRVEEQLDEMYQPVVNLKSGGYLVIQQTEALVSIDVNSGKATKERNVEQTALKTNSEAAVEVARQCRLRDLAGLIVIDFIDMEENRNNRAVEKKLKEAMKNDRARTQIGSISNFGLLEMSRQRRRSGIVDGTTQACPVCQGAGAVRSHEMAALRILRAAEGVAANGKHSLVTVKTSTEVALYVLNTKRPWLMRMEELYGVKTNIIADAGKFSDQYEVTGSGTPADRVSLKETIGEDGPLSDLEAPELPSGDDSDTAAESDGDDKPKKRRKRRRRKPRDGESQSAQDEAATADDGDATTGDAQTSSEETAAATDTDPDGDSDDSGRKKRRRGRRGGRRNRRKTTEVEAQEAGGDSASGDGAAAASTANAEHETDAGELGETEKTAGDDQTRAGEASRESGAESGEVVDLDAQRQSRGETGDRAEDTETGGTPSDDGAEAEKAPATGATSGTGRSEGSSPDPEDGGGSRPRRVGWWQRAFQKS